MHKRLALMAILGSVFFSQGAAVLAQTSNPPPVETHDPDQCDNKPVIMVVEGRTIDLDRIVTYGKAIRDSGLYPKLGGYYIDRPRPIAVFEGTSPPERSVLLVRHPAMIAFRPPILRW